MRQLVTLIALLVPLMAVAQDRDGNDTAGDWVTTHYQSFGQWDSACDERPLTTEPGSGIERRCYLRYVDVFSPRPEFAAQFVFVAHEGNGVRVRFGSEPGTRFVRGGFRVERDGRTVWSTARTECLTGGECIFRNEEGAGLLEVLRQGGVWRFDFTDRHGKLRSLTWDLSPFATAFADLTAETDKRGLR